jgi:hypothetical protein
MRSLKAHDIGCRDGDLDEITDAERLVQFFDCYKNLAKQLI